MASKQTEMIEPEAAFLLAAAAQWASIKKTPDASAFAVHSKYDPATVGAERPFLRGLFSIYPPGAIRQFAPPRYPMKTKHDVHYCDMTHWVTDVWNGLRKYEKV
ncbi:MAG: hypothetical protein OXH52_01200 [Gammaproteobacteria bacterium]|nr:hypothetical protein [Gammaproteobacteria bacterium]